MPKRRKKAGDPWTKVALVVLALLLGYAFFATRRGDLPAIKVSETEALARVIRSEIGIGTQQQKVHIAWVTRNLAASRKQSITEMACSPCGPQQAGRPVSSLQPATDSDRALATAVLAAPKLLDPTGGATHFINPKLQDELARKGRAGYRGRSYSSVSRQWRRQYKWRPYYRLGNTLELWGPIK